LNKIFKKSSWDIHILVVGMGEIGRPIFEIIEENSEYTVYGEDLDVSKCSPNLSKIPDEIDIMHICIPCKDMVSFIKTVSICYKKYTPKLLIINSTVPPRTTHFIADVLQEYKPNNKPDCLIAHSPMFGTHYNDEEMKDQFIYYPHIIGGINQQSSQVTDDYFKELEFTTMIVSSPLESEIMKIMETTYAGWMITFFNEFHRMAMYYDAEFPEIVGALAKTYEPRREKPIWFPSVIEGHCIMQNIDLLLQPNVYNAGFLELIKASNDLRKEEILDEKIKEDIEKIKIIKDEMNHDKS